MSKIASESLAHVLSKLESRDRQDLSDAHNQLSEWSTHMARELLAARQVIEAASKLLESSELGHLQNFGKLLNTQFGHTQLEEAMLAYEKVLKSNLFWFEELPGREHL